MYIGLLCIYALSELDSESIASRFCICAPFFVSLNRHDRRENRGLAITESVERETFTERELTEVARQHIVRAKVVFRRNIAESTATIYTHENEHFGVSFGSRRSRSGRRASDAAPVAPSRHSRATGVSCARPGRRHSHRR